MIGQNIAHSQMLGGGMGVVDVLYMSFPHYVI